MEEMELVVNKERFGFTDEQVEKILDELWEMEFFNGYEITTQEELDDFCEEMLEVFAD